MSEKMRSGVLILFLVLGKFSATLLGHVFKPTMSQQVPSSSKLNLRGYVDDSMNVSKYKREGHGHIGTQSSQPFILIQINISIFLN